MEWWNTGSRMAPSHIRRSQGPPFDENAFLKGLETLSQTDKEKEAGHNALRSRTCATFGPPLYSAARGRRRRRQSKGSDQNKILKHQHLEHPIFPLKVPPLHRTTILPGERKRNNKEKCKALALLVQKSQNAKTSLRLGSGPRTKYQWTEWKRKIGHVSLQLIQFWGNNF